MKQAQVWLVIGTLLGVACSDNDNGDGRGFAQAGTGTAGQQGAGTGAGSGGVQAAGVGASGQSAAGTAAGTDAPLAGTGVAGSAGVAGGEPVAGDGSAGTGASGNSGGPPPEECRGFSFDSLIYSPGGTTLPNTCEPFHATLNNPYAVRCVDAWPWYDSGFPGDEFCILPPPPDKGIQYGVHPQGKDWFAQVSTGDMSGYENPTDAFVMSSGEEEERNYATGAPNELERNFYRNNVRMRAGSHHMIVSTTSGAEPQEVWSAASAGGLRSGTGLPGAQRPDENNPKSLEKPTEDAGYYSTIPARPGVTFNMHHFNASDDTTLKEAWTNLWWEEDARVRGYGILGLNVAQVLTLNVQAGQTVDLHYAWNISEQIRVVSLFGHRHARTTNFSSWVEKPGGDTEIVYQSFDWFDEPTYRYDSLTENPVPQPDTLRDGAKSGIFMLEPGDKLHFNCRIQFTEERAASEGAPSPTTIPGGLRFANQAFTAEMCILFGQSAAVSLESPPVSTSPLPSFATAQ
jgi:hypothetical protein